MFQCECACRHVVRFVAIRLSVLCWHLCANILLTLRGQTTSVGTFRLPYFPHLRVALSPFYPTPTYPLFISLRVCLPPFPFFSLFVLPHLRRGRQISATNKQHTYIKTYFFSSHPLFNITRLISRVLDTFFRKVAQTGVAEQFHIYFANNRWEPSECSHSARISRARRRRYAGLPRDG